MSKTRIGPDFIIGGAPKCATSTVFSWLNDHPAIAGASKKETFFLMDVGHPQLPEWNIHNQGLNGFTSFFQSANGDQIRMEGTTQYLYQKTPIEFGKNHPSCKFLFILRDPVKRIYSSFDYAKNNLASINNDVTFKDFVQAALGIEKIDGVLGVNELLPFELEYGLYSKYLKNWKKEIDESRVRVVIFEDLVANPLKYTKELAMFLGVDPSFYDAYVFEKKNVSVTIKKQGLHRLAKKMRNIVPLNSVKSIIKNIYYKLQATGKEHLREAIHPEDQAFLVSYYRDDVESLKQDFKLDVSKWSFD